MGSIRRFLIVLSVAALFAGACSGGTLPGPPGDVNPSGPSGSGPTSRPTNTELEGSTAPRSLEEHGAVGALGPVLLDGTVPHAVLEVDTSPGEHLVGSARDGLVGALRDHGGKQVTFAGGDTLPSRAVWTTDQIRSAASGHRSQSATPGDTVVVQVVVLDGRQQDGSVLGEAVDASTFAIFPDQMQGGLLASVAFGVDDVEQSVAVHELGHLFGLVDLTGQGAFHEDPDHPGHSNDRASVMYWAVETDAVSRIFHGPPPSSFDQADAQEMARIRG